MDIFSIIIRLCRPTKSCVILSLTINTSFIFGFDFYFCLQQSIKFVILCHSHGYTNTQVIHNNTNARLYRVQGNGTVGRIASLEMEKKQIIWKGFEGQRLILFPKSLQTKTDREEVLMFKQTCANISTNSKKSIQDLVALISTKIMLKKISLYFINNFILYLFLGTCVLV